MIKRRRNFSLGGYKSRVTGNPREMYKTWHWGVEPQANPIEVNDPDYPDSALIECGRLVEFTYRAPRQSLKIKDRLYKLPKSESNKTHLVFDPYHPNDRLYIVSTSKKALSNFKNDLYKSNPYQECPLSDISLFAGGRHAMDDYPEVSGKVIGVLTSIVYACKKKGDGYSFYVHQLGEETGIQPLICVDDKGRLWIVGGNYTSPIQGITD